MRFRHVRIRIERPVEGRDRLLQPAGTPQGGAEISKIDRPGERLDRRADPGDRCRDLAPLQGGEPRKVHGFRVSRSAREDDLVQPFGGGKVATSVQGQSLLPEYLDAGMGHERTPPSDGLGYAAIILNGMLAAPRKTEQPIGGFDLVP